MCKARLHRQQQQIGCIPVFVSRQFYIASRRKPSSERTPISAINKRCTFALRQRRTFGSTPTVLLYNLHICSQLFITRREENYSRRLSRFRARYQTRNLLHATLLFFAVTRRLFLSLDALNAAQGAAAFIFSPR